MNSKAVNNRGVPKIDAILDPGTPSKVRYTGPFPPPLSLRERAVYRIISLISEGALS